MPDIDGVELAQAVIDAAKKIIEEIDSDDAQEFAESVKEKAESMKEWSEERNGYLTDKQQTALQNMLQGCRNWLKKFDVKVDESGCPF